MNSLHLCVGKKTALATVSASDETMATSLKVESKTTSGEQKHVLNKHIAM